MKKRIIFPIFLVLMIFLIDQNVFAETEEEKEREELVKDAANSLKRENTRSDTIASDDESEKKDKEEIKKKLSKLKETMEIYAPLANIILKKQQLQETEEAYESQEDFKKTASTAS